MWKQTLDLKDEQECMEEFLETYKRLPSLWDKTCKEYADRIVKSRHYNILVAKYRKLYPNAQRIDVVRKINNLRTNFRKEYKKVQESAQKGEIRVPTLWYYKYLTFLVDDNEHSEKDLENKSDNEFETISHTLTDSASQSPVASPEPHNLYKILKEEEEEEHEIGTQNNIPLATTSKSQERSEDKPQIINRNNIRRRNMSRLIAWQRSQRIQPQQSEDYQQIAMVWGLELSKMQPKQQIYAKKAINEILYEGQLGNLHSNVVNLRNTRKSNEDPLEEV